MHAPVDRFAFTLLLVATLVGCATQDGNYQSAALDLKSAHCDGHTREPQSGECIFQAFCAACHGTDARGTGPIAPLFSVHVPDLTSITARRGGEFPELEIFRIIDGQSEITAHGSRHMPVWGYEFFRVNREDELAHKEAVDKVDSLVDYLRSIQGRLPSS